MSSQKNLMNPDNKRIEHIITRYIFAMSELAKKPNPETQALNEQVINTVKGFYDVMEDYLNQIEESLDIATPEVYRHG